MNIRKSLYGMSIGLVLLLVVGCGAPMSTPVPAMATLVPGIEAPVDVGGTQVRIAEVNFGKYVGTRVTDNEQDLGLLGGYEAEEGFRYAEVVIKVTQEELIEEVSQWAVALQDSEGNSYEAVVRGTGYFYGEVGNVGWTFHIPENTSQLTLLFPGGVSVDLSPLIAE